MNKKGSDRENYMTSKTNTRQPQNNGDLRAANAKTETPPVQPTPHNIPPVHEVNTAPNNLHRT